MLEQMEKCTNIESKGIQPIKKLGPMPVYEMTREPKCDKRKQTEEG